jgi:hypothetical protein
MNAFERLKMVDLASIPDARHADQPAWTAPDVGEDD